MPNKNTKSEQPRPSTLDFQLANEILEILDNMEPSSQFIALIIAERMLPEREAIRRATKSLVDLQDPSMPKTLPEAVDYLIDHSNAGWQEVARLRRRIEDFKKRYGSQ